MTANSTCADRVTEQADEALNRLDRLKSFLLTAVDLEREDHSRRHFLTQEARAACIVGSLAELEALTRTFLCQMNEEINDSQVALHSLKPCLRGLAGHAHFESLRNSSDSENIWHRRATLTNLETSHEIAVMPLPIRGPQPPLDGKTLTPSHFSRIWKVYGISGDPVPDLSSGQTLQKLSGLRNDIAHGNLPFVEIFRTAGTGAKEVEHYVSQMSLLVIHLACAWSAYAENKEYMHHHHGDVPRAAAKAVSRTQQLPGL